MITKIIFQNFFFSLRKYKIFYVLLALAIVVLNMPSCLKEYSCEDGDCYIIPSDTIIIPDSLYFFDITVNGERILKIAGQDEYNLYNGDDIDYFYSGMSTFDFKSSFEFDKGTLTYNGADSIVQKIAFFAPGNYNYSTDSVHINGVELRWKDSTGRPYRTSTGDQTGSNFTITSTDSLFDGSNNLYGLKVSAMFNCWLYNNRNSEKKQLTSGRFSFIIDI